MNIIETKNLTFSYKKQVVLSDLSLQVPQGSIYGYLGANGSGKTTTIRLLLGLLDTTKAVFVGNHDMRIAQEKIAAYEHIGSLVSPIFMYDYLTVQEHFEMLKIAYNKTTVEVEQTLAKIGISEYTNKKVKYLSSGNRQRLAIGFAIFNNPQILILDEPINGLDPVGIYDMRELFLALNKQGMTIFFSSHILSEVEKICTDIGILHEGKLLYQGKLDALLADDSNHSLENVYLKLIKNDQLI